MNKWFHPLLSVGWNFLSIHKLHWCNRWSLWMDKKFLPTLYWTCDYVSMLGLKSNHVSKNQLCCQIICQQSIFSLPVICCHHVFMSSITWGDHREADFNTHKTIAPPLYIDCLMPLSRLEGFIKISVTVYTDQKMFIWSLFCSCNFLFNVVCSTQNILKYILGAWDHI